MGTRGTGVLLGNRSGCRGTLGLRVFLPEQPHQRKDRQDPNGPDLGWEGRTARACSSGCGSGWAKVHGWRVFGTLLAVCGREPGHCRPPPLGPLSRHMGPGGCNKGPELLTGSSPQKANENHQCLSWTWCGPSPSPCLPVTVECALAGSFPPFVGSQVVN